MARLRDLAAAVAADADPGIVIHRTSVRRGTRYEAARQGQALGVATVYTGGDEEGWTIDGASHDTLASWLDTVCRIGRDA